MTYIEYALYDLDYTEEEIKYSIESAVSLGVQCISVPFALTKFCKTITKNTPTIVSNPIDYPMGLLDTKTRNCAVTNAIENGAEKIEIMIQNNYLNYKKYDKIRSDIVSNSLICKEKNIPLNYFLEYRVFTHHSLIKACNLLLEAPVSTVYVSSGYLLDNIDDNIIASVLLEQKTNIKTIFNGNIWHKKHVEILDKNKINFLRFNTINSIRTYKNFTKNNG